MQAPHYRERFPVRPDARAKERKRNEILATLPENATFEDKQWALNPKAMKQRTDADKRKANRIAKHNCYLASINDANLRDRTRSPLKMSATAYAIFCRYYSNETAEAWKSPPELLAELATCKRDSPYQFSSSASSFQARPSINFDQFPLANRTAIEHRTFRARPVGESYPPQMGMPDYEPQAGSVETCANLLDSYESVVASPLYAQVISLLRWESPILSSAALLATSLALLLLKTCVMTVNFLLGVITGVIFINKPFFHSAYTPQAALASDDGALFTGKTSLAQKKKPATSSRPASTSAPGVQAIPTIGGKPLVPPTQPAPSEKPPSGFPPRTKNMNLLNGFGIGI